MDKEIAPVHVAIIPDGNRRWAKSKGLKKVAGHTVAGSYENISDLFRAARDLGVKCVSIWGFSTENWNRDEDEVKQILGVISKGIDKFLERMHKEKIKFVHVGRRDRLPNEMVANLETLERETEDYGDFVAALCLDYGGRDEIVRAVGKILEEGKEVGEEDFLKYLDTAGIPDPDLVIRTGGEKRLSGFMPFQSTYAELLFTDKFFPDFSPDDLKKAVSDFAARERRFGRG